MFTTAKNRMSLRRLACFLMWFGFGIAPLMAGDEGQLLADFETDADLVVSDSPGASLVAENAKTGKQCLKITHAGEGYPGLSFTKPAQLKPFVDYPMFAVDVYNPSDTVLKMSARADDGKSVDYGTRYNEDGLAIPPGWSTLRINLTGMTTSNSNNFLERRAIDRSTLKQFSIFLHPHKLAQPVVLFFDNVRLEGTGLPKVEGLTAFDFGPSSSAVFPGFTGVNEKSIFSDKTGFGWGTTGRTRRPGNPDDLGGDYGTGDRFTALMKGGPGDYVVHLCIDTLGEWGGIQHFASRTVTVNGVEVLTETMDGDKFMRERFFKFMDGDDLPGIDIWTERVMPLTPVRTFTTKVGADQKIVVKVDAQGGWPGLICFLVAYPKANQAAGDAFMAALDKRRKMLFDNSIVVTTPKADHDKATPTAADTARGYIYFTRSAATDLATSAQPTAEERAAPLTFQGCRTERQSLQLGVLPLQDAKALSVTVSDLSGPNGAELPGSAVTVRKVRIFAKRGGRNNSLTLQPFLLQEFSSLPLTKDVARSLWLTLTVPAEALTGVYRGTVTVTVDGKSTAIPLTLSVLKYTLAPVDDISISGLGTTAGSWRSMFPGFDERWWAMADKIMADQAVHGCNAVTGGPGMKLTAIKDGRAEIDFTDADRWMDLAKKHGLTLPGDSYQGFDVQLGFHVSSAKDCMAANEKNAQNKWGVSFEELVRAAYSAVEAHAKEKGWPARSYYLLDEPRPEFGNVESALELLKLYAKAAPGVRISGYTTVSAEGREHYIPYLPVVISHPTEDELKRVLAAGKECWDYGAGHIGNGFGRWLYAARRKGVKGFTTGFMYVNSNPYFDFSDVEGSWGIVHPSPAGPVATPSWERLAMEVNRYRYLKTLEVEMAKAKSSGRKVETVAAAQKFLDEIVSTVDIGKHRSSTLDASAWTAYQAELFKHLAAVEERLPGTGLPPGSKGTAP